MASRRKVLIERAHRTSSHLRPSWGATDPGGFAALGVNETLVHTYDIAQGLGVSWLPPESLCAAALARLFPDAPEGDPVQVLLWSTGRAELENRPPVTSWVLKAAID